MPRIKKTASPLAIMIGLFLLAASPALALKGINADGTLDKQTISKAYFEGEFWTVINALEAFRKSGMKTSREDSVYTFKYLSVVYAADPTTRKKAESYMYQLIKMMPTIDLIDLYISDNIESIFKKVKSDYEKLEKVHAENSPGMEASKRDSSAALAAAKPQAKDPVATRDATARAQENPDAPDKPAQEKKKPGIKPWVPLALGGIGVAATAYFLLTLGSGSESGADSPRPVEVTVVTPNQGSQ
jgi:hypothetical protein